MLCITCSVSLSPKGNSHGLTFPLGGSLMTCVHACSICFPRTSHPPVTFCSFHKWVLVPFKAFFSIYFIIIALQIICQLNSIPYYNHGYYSQPELPRTLSALLILGHRDKFFFLRPIFLLQGPGKVSSLALLSLFLGHSARFFFLRPIFLLQGCE